MADISGVELVVGGVVTGVTAAGGGVVAWFAKQVVGVRDDVRTIKTKLYGDTNDERRDGIVSKVEHIETVVEDIDRRVVDVESRTAHIEKVCSVQHGEKVFFRPSTEGA